MTNGLQQKVKSFTLLSHQQLSLPKPLCDLPSPYGLILHPKLYAELTFQWPTVDRGVPTDGAWSDSIKNVDNWQYCGEDFSVYNVTFADVSLKCRLVRDTPPQSSAHWLCRLVPGTLDRWPLRQGCNGPR